MDFSELLTDALGLQDIVIEKYKTNKETLKAEIWVRQDRDTCCFNFEPPAIAVSK
jgi:hypothetical protein